MTLRVPRNGHSKDKILLLGGGHVCTRHAEFLTFTEVTRIASTRSTIGWSPVTLLFPIMSFTSIRKLMTLPLLILLLLGFVDSGSGTDGTDGQC